MIKVYTTPGCLGCRMVIKFLEKHNVPFTEKDITKNKFTPQELKDALMLSNNGFSDILSEKSLAYKQLSEQLNNSSYNDAIHIIIDNPLIISRPIVVQYINNRPLRLLVGYNSQDVEILLNSDYSHTIKKITKLCSFELAGKCVGRHDKIS